MDVADRKNPVTEFSSARLARPALAMMGERIRAAQCRHDPERARALDAPAVRIFDAMGPDPFRARRLECAIEDARIDTAPMITRIGGYITGGDSALCKEVRRAQVARECRSCRAGNPYVYLELAGSFHITPAQIRATPIQFGAGAVRPATPATRDAEVPGAARSEMALKGSSGTLGAPTRRELRRMSPRWYASCTPESMRANSQFCARVMQEPARDAELPLPAECSGQKRASGGLPWRR